MTDALQRLQTRALGSGSQIECTREPLTGWVICLISHSGDTNSPGDKSGVGGTSAAALAREAGLVRHKYTTGQRCLSENTWLDYPCCRAKSLARRVSVSVYANVVRSDE